MSGYKYDGCHSNRQNQVILNCGTGTGVILPDHSEENSQLLNPYVVASVTIDTRGMLRPTVKIDFSSIVTYKEDNDYYISDLRLTFRLSKICGGAKIPLGTWNYERNVDLNLYGVANAEAGGEQQLRSNGYVKLTIETVDSFGFIFCECHDCPDCCHYIVELTNVETNGVDFSSVTQAVITAMAVGPMAE